MPEHAPARRSRPPKDPMSNDERRVYVHPLYVHPPVGPEASPASDGRCALCTIGAFKGSTGPCVFTARESCLSGSSNDPMRPYPGMPWALSVRLRGGHQRKLRVKVVHAHHRMINPEIVTRRHGHHFK